MIRKQQNVSGIAFHWYNNGNAPPELLDILAKEFPDHFILNTEASVMDANRGHGDNLHLGSWGSGEAYANDIITVRFNINLKSLIWL